MGIDVYVFAEEFDGKKWNYLENLIGCGDRNHVVECELLYIDEKIIPKNLSDGGKKEIFRYEKTMKDLYENFFKINYITLTELQKINFIKNLQEDLEHDSYFNLRNVRDWGELAEIIETLEYYCEDNYLNSDNIRLIVYHCQ